MASIANAHTTEIGSMNSDSSATNTTEMIVNDASSEKATFWRLNESNARSSQQVAASMRAGQASACR